MARLVELQDDDETVVRYFAAESLAIVAERLEGPDATGVEKGVDPVEQLVDTTFDALGLGEQPNLPCSLHVVPDGPRLTAKSSGGVELYTWRAEDGGSLFSLLWGTKREKSATEIKSECALSTPSEVESVFAYLAPGEHVVWAQTPNSRSDQAYPVEVGETLRAQAKHVGISLVGGPEAQK